MRQLLEGVERIGPPLRFLTANDGPPTYLFEQHPDGLSPSQIERLKQIEAALARGMKDALAMGRTGIGRTFADHEAKQLGLSFDWDQHRPALAAITRAVVAAYVEAGRRSFGEPVQTPEAPEGPESAVAARVNSLPVPKSSRSLRSLHDIAAEWKVARKARPDAVGKTMRAIGLLEQAGAIGLPAYHRAGPRRPLAHATRWWLGDDNMLRAFSLHEKPMEHGVLVAAAILGAGPGDVLDVPRDPFDLRRSQLRKVAAA